MCDCYSPINCILPPEMVKNIKVKGGKKEKRWAEELEEESKRYRSLRSGNIPSSAYKPAPKVKEGDKGNRYREVHDDQQKNFVRKEGQPKCGNADVDAAFEFAGAVYDFFFKEFRRDSLDGKGFKLVARVNYRVHPRKPYPNAQWDLTDKEMKYGEGCLQKDKDRYGETYGIYNSFSRDLSISAHEHAHGIIQFSGGLEYHSQAGALNESIADVFSSMVTQYAKKQTAHKASWLIGENVFNKKNRNYKTGMALRSLKAPGKAYEHKILGKDMQPFHMDNYDPDRGPHVNSGIPNHAFYLMAIQMGGYSWDKAGKIWYNALEKADNPLLRFNEWADLTIQEATKLYGDDSPESLITRRAWKLVGVEV